MKPNQVVMDIECYRDFFLVMFVNSKGQSKYFEMYEGHPLDTLGVMTVMQAAEVVTFNGNGYDIPILTLALSGADNATLKVASDAIIQEQLRPWNFYKRYHLEEPRWNHIDLIEPAPAVKISLKLYGGRMHSKRLQDLPIEPDASISPEQRLELIKYCRNDLDTTIDLLHAIDDRIDLRRKMGEQYGLDLRSKSDAQIAEAVIKKEVEKITGEKIKKGKVVRRTFYYQKPEFIRFKSEQLQNSLDIVLNSEFISEDNGVIKMSEELETLVLKIGNTKYQMGMGGLHSQENETSHVADEEYELWDFDVASYYPNIFIQLGLYPEAVGEHFLTIFKNLTKMRLDAKRAGNKIVADSVKVCVNGTFGKTGSIYSILFAPNLMIQTTVTGQLALLMLIERLESLGVSVVSANTDGIVMKVRKTDIETKLLPSVKGWEKHTGFEMEGTQYVGLYSRDVNSYVAIKPDGKFKTKGFFATGGLQKSPTNEICSKAFVKFLQDGTDIEETIYGSTDIREFLSIRTVKGGAVKTHGDILPEHSSKEELVRMAGFTQAEGRGNWRMENTESAVKLAGAYEIACKKLRDTSKDEYLGKAIRWYYAKDIVGTINYKTNGNTVPRSEGAKPCMVLPDEFPNDIDYDWYIKEAYDMMMDVGLKKRPMPDKIPRKNCKAWQELVDKGYLIQDGEEWVWYT